MNKELKTKLDWALYYQSIGLSIIPVGANKISLIKWESYQDKCAIVDEINNWWKQWPDANPALVTGNVSGVVALDLDIKHGRTSKEFQIPPTVSARSGGGGEHFFFRYPLNGPVKSASAISGEGVDSRGDKGYVLLAPSVNETGGAYEWVVPFESKDDLAEMPEWLKKIIVDSISDKKWLLGKEGVSEGSRNETAASMAGKILSSMDSELWEILGWDQFEIWNSKNAPPLPGRELRSVWESIKKINASDIQDDSKKSQANILLEDILSRKDVSLFHDEQSEGYISLEIGGHQENWGCKSKALKRWIASEIYRTQKKAPGSEMIKSILAVLEGKARFDGSEIELQNRIAWHKGELWYDLTNKAWQAVKINKEGWEIVDKPPIVFKRHSHNKAQVVPIRNGDIKLFLNYIKITNEEYRLLLLVFFVSCFISDFPHVMLVVFGAQGSSKSTFSRLLRLGVDPSLLDVTGFPHNQKELIQALAHHYFLFFDNVSHISEDQSDLLCRSITGGGHTKRELYSDDEDIIYNFMRCIGLNGINLVTTRPDLLERSLLLEIERIEEMDRKTEKELFKNFENDMPSILGGVFNTIVKAMQIEPTIKLNSYPRMADWTQWGCAIAEALGFTKEEFLKAYKANINRQTEMLINENIVATAIITFMEDKEEWKDTPTELLLQLINHASFVNIDTREKYWPKGANALSRRINELSTPLKQMGILMTISTSGTERYIHIQKISKGNPIQETPTEKSIPTDDTDGIDDIIPMEQVSREEIPF